MYTTLLGEVCAWFLVLWHGSVPPRLAISVFYNLTVIHTHCWAQFQKAENIAQQFSLISNKLLRHQLKQCKLYGVLVGNQFLLRIVCCLCLASFFNTYML